MLVQLKGSGLFYDGIALFYIFNKKNYDNPPVTVVGPSDKEIHRFGREYKDYFGLSDEEVHEVTNDIFCEEGMGSLFPTHLNRHCIGQVLQDFRGDVFEVSRLASDEGEARLSLYERAADYLGEWRRQSSWRKLRRKGEFTTPSEDVSLVEDLVNKVSEDPSLKNYQRGLSIARETYEGMPFFRDVKDLLHLAYAGHPLFDNLKSHFLKKLEAIVGDDLRTADLHKRVIGSYSSIPLDAQPSRGFLGRGSG